MEQSSGPAVLDVGLHDVLASVIQNKVIQNKFPIDIVSEGEFPQGNAEKTCRFINNVLDSWMHVITAASPQ